MVGAPSRAVSLCWLGRNSCGFLLPRSWLWPGEREFLQIALPDEPDPRIACQNEIRGQASIEAPCEAAARDATELGGFGEAQVLRAIRVHLTSLQQDNKKSPTSNVGLKGLWCVNCCPHAEAISQRELTPALQPGWR